MVYLSHEDETNRDSQGPIEVPRDQRISTPPSYSMLQINELKGQSLEAQYDPCEERSRRKYCTGGNGSDTTDGVREAEVLYCTMISKGEWDSSLSVTENWTTEKGENGGNEDEDEDE
ncbi:unnamed protein product, partial [Pleuronectes platessa]